jgi:AbrB family looped-hinge helix DNA binding protein
MITQIRGKAQLTIPKEIIKQLNLKTGDHINVEIENGTLVLKPVVMIPKEQAWFWSKEWQAGEKEAEADIKAGRITEEMDVKETMAHLDSLKGESR